MKILAALPLAVILALGAVGAQAAPMMHELYAERDAALNVIGPVSDTPHHPCHGASSGTAHPRCGSLTGGPSGSLF